MKINLFKTYKSFKCILEMKMVQKNIKEFIIKSSAILITTFIKLKDVKYNF